MPVVAHSMLPVSTLWATSPWNQLQVPETNSCSGKLRGETQCSPRHTLRNQREYVKYVEYAECVQYEKQYQVVCDCCTQALQHRHKGTVELFLSSISLGFDLEQKKKFAEPDVKPLISPDNATCWVRFSRHIHCPQLEAVCCQSWTTLFQMLKKQRFYTENEKLWNPLL